MKRDNLQSNIKQELLDPNHSHFLLVDNAQLNCFGGEIDFRARLESHIQHQIPVVVVVIEGGPNTVKTVLKSIQNKIPCIFVDKSGRFSDIVSFIYETIMHKEEDANEKKNKLLVREEVEEEISQKNLKTNLIE